ncbi:aldehyde dehydrogenase family protein [Akkermansiaceae bacterium]|nr:aldehyde dehydrogenase family protein [Akkermansiaceae bacterium]
MTIKKTYKLFIGGKFPRTESGRVLDVRGKDGELLANASWASRKDFREAVVAARKASGGWAKASAYLKGQILYRIAEMLEGRRAQFVSELVAHGLSEEKAEKDVSAAIDLLVHYAGWSDKYQALFSTVNPVASSHFNFSAPAPTGVVGIVAPRRGSLPELVSALAPVIVGGNSVVVLAGENALTAISFAEVLATSDVPAGVVNILTGHRSELIPEFAKHMDVNAVLLCSNDKEEKKLVDLESAENLKRVSHQKDASLKESPYHILDFQEIKTTWHPIGI